MVSRMLSTPVDISEMGIGLQSKEISHSPVRFGAENNTSNELAMSEHVSEKSKQDEAVKKELGSSLSQEDIDQDIKQLDYTLADPNFKKGTGKFFT